MRDVARTAGGAARRVVVRLDIVIVGLMEGAMLGELAIAIASGGTALVELTQWFAQALTSS